MAPTSGGAAALATELERRALDVAEREIEALDIAEVGGADMEAIAAWGARMYLLGMAERPAPVARPAAYVKPAPAPAVRRRKRTDRREVAEACAASGHRTPGADGLCACGAHAVDRVPGAGGAR